MLVWTENKQHMPTGIIMIGTLFEMHFFSERKFNLPSLFPLHSACIFFVISLTVVFFLFHILFLSFVRCIGKTVRVNVSMLLSSSPT